jgi:RNA polymerase sigma factor (sigma-70 family)
MKYTPRTDNNFWGNIKRHDTLIKKCFYYLFKKYPNHDGINEAFNILLVQLHHLNVFKRFDATRPKNQDLDKAFQQFIYKYVEKIMGDTYRSRINHSKRFAHSEHVEEITPVTYNIQVNPNDTSFAKQEDFDKYGYVKKPIRRDYPSINDLGEYVGEKGFNALDELEATDLVEKVKSILKGNVEKRVFELREKYGLSVIDIADIIGCSSQNVSLILNKIKNRCIEKGYISNRKREYAKVERN